MALTRPRSIDDFFDNYDEVESYGRSLEYVGEINPPDGIFYPGINFDVPEYIKDQVVTKTSKVARHPLSLESILFRLSILGHAGPHQAHEDSLMGDYLVVVYLGSGDGGTSLVRHRESGMDATPTTSRQLDLWRRDTNRPEAWEVTKLIRGRANRAAIIPAGLMHRAEPVGGLGETVENGRLVLVAFLKKET